MSLFEILLLLGAGTCAGAINAVAGGGTFFTFAALTALGLTPLIANATSAVGLALANLASVAGYLPEVRAHYRRYLGLSIVGSIGGAAGAILLTQTSPDAFKVLVPYFLAVATLLFAVAPYIRKFTNHAKPSPALLRVMEVFVSVYGGYFGAGMGVMMLASLSLSEQGDFHFINAAKNVWAFFIQTLSVVLFIIWGLTAWKPALLIMVSSALSGYFGVSLARRIPQNWIRALVIVAGLALTIRFFLV